MLRVQERFAVGKRRPQMHRDVRDFRLRQFAPHFPLEFAHAFARQRHQLGIMRFDFAEQRVANVHIHFEPAD